MKWITLLALLSLLPSCAPMNGYATFVLGPSSSVTRSQSMNIANAYTQMRWTPSAKNISHSLDRDDILVHTPDHQLSNHGYANGWWWADRENASMPYQWGGFDTPESFLRKIGSGHAAGDIATAEKRTAGDAAVSKQAAGIDCSGFVSRCWRLSRPFSTAQLPAISTPIRWAELKPGDIFLNDKHVLLFAQWAVPGSAVLCYEAGPFPQWKVSAARIPPELLFAQGYEPRRYTNITEDPS